MTDERVANYYDTAIFEAELVRLDRDFPVGRAITTRWLDRLIPEASEIAEIGVGAGLYSEFLARKHCRRHLVDVSARLLEAAQQRLHAAGLAASIAAAARESATHLSSLASAAFDAVLLLGPLYHLCSPEARRQAVAESARFLKPGGRLFAAGINRLAYLRELFRESPHLAAARRAFHDGYLRDGNLDPDRAPPIGFAHMSTVAEFRALFQDADAWLELIERTGQTPEGLSLSDHFLYIGARRP